MSLYIFYVLINSVQSFAMKIDLYVDNWHYSDAARESWRFKQLKSRPFVQHFQGKTKIYQHDLHNWAFVCGNCRWPMDSPHEGPIKRKAFPCHNLYILTHWSPVKYIRGSYSGHPIFQVVSCQSSRHRGDLPISQGSVCACAQPMRVGVTM